MTPACHLFRPTADGDNVLEVLQYEVQRKLGRCRLCLQLYERLLKAMVTGMAVEGPTLVGMFTGDHLRAALSDVDAGPDDDASSGGQSVDVTSASMRFNISMSLERYAQTKDGLAELVVLRNDLVHHLIERFDIFDENGCRAAVTHLDNCYEQTDGHVERLKGWTASLDETREMMSSSVQSKSFEDMFVHGINPDGSVCWARSTIVECLHEAETACQVDG